MEKVGGQNRPFSFSCPVCSNLTALGVGAGGAADTDQLVVAGIGQQVAGTPVVVEVAAAHIAVGAAVVVAPFSL